jgi:hypothetical protein
MTFRSRELLLEVLMLHLERGSLILHNNLHCNPTPPSKKKIKWGNKIRHKMYFS